MIKLLIPFALAAASAAPAAVPAQVVAVPTFTAIELVGGGTVVMRHGASQRVTLNDGGGRTTMAVDGEGKLTIAACGGSCRGGAEPTIVVVTPSTVGVLATKNGGHIRSDGAWPSQSALTIAAGRDGTIDLTGMPADDITATAGAGSSIRVAPRSGLVAVTSRGGSISYRGSPHVVQVVNGGGTIERIRG